MLKANEFYVPTMPTPEQNTRLSTAQLNSSRMICLNCSQCHAEIQGTCVQRKVYKRQKSRSLSPRLPPNRSVLSANIPSLLDLPVMHAINRSGSSQPSVTNNSMDRT